MGSLFCAPVSNQPQRRLLAWRFDRLEVSNDLVVEAVGLEPFAQGVELFETEALGGQLSLTGMHTNNGGV